MSARQRKAKAKRDVLIDKIKRLEVIEASYALVDEDLERCGVDVVMSARHTLRMVLVFIRADIASMKSELKLWSLPK